MSSDEMPKSFSKLVVTSAIASLREIEPPASRAAYNMKVMNNPRDRGMSLLTQPASNLAYLASDAISLPRATVTLCSNNVATALFSVRGGPARLNNHVTRPKNHL